MTEHFCDNPYCEAQAAQTVHVSENRAEDSTRRLCVSCEEVFTWGVQHGAIGTRETLQRQLREKDRRLRAQARALRRIRREADFRQDDGAMDLGNRLLEIDRRAAQVLESAPGNGSAKR
jgi:hypothetical protein